MSKFQLKILAKAIAESVVYHIDELIDYNDALNENARRCDLLREGIEDSIARRIQTMYLGALRIEDKPDETD